MIKTLHHSSSYLYSLVGVIDDSPGTNGSRPNTKKFFSYLKNILKKDDQLCTYKVQKANLLNEQFQSVFTPKSPLIL